MKVVGRDATPMTGRDGTDTSYETDTLLMGAGESYDAIFTAPAQKQGLGAYDTYVLYNRRYTQDDDSGYAGSAHRSARLPCRNFPAQGTSTTRYGI